MMSDVEELTERIQESKMTYGELEMKIASQSETYRLLRRIKDCMDVQSETILTLAYCLDSAATLGAGSWNLTFHYEDTVIFYTANMCALMTFGCYSTLFPLALVRVHEAVS